MGEFEHVDLYFDSDFKGVVSSKCPQCGLKLKSSLGNLLPGKHLNCSCGGLVSFNENDISEFQRILDNLKTATEGLTRQARLPV